MSTALLYERLGLGGEWGDPDFEVQLPDTLPQNNTLPLSSTDLRDLEAALEALKRLGARKKVLYWCIGQLGPGAEDARQGTKHSGGIGEDGQPVGVVSRKPAMATRQDMAGLFSKVRSAAQGIRKYREELLLLSEACNDIELPSGMMTEPELPEEALLLLLNSLSWVSRLSLEWQSPNPTQLMKSKGLLFMLTYVWISTMNSQASGGVTRRLDATRDNTAARLPNSAAQEVAIIAHIFLGADFTTGDLSDKLQDFASGEPALFKELNALMQTLHSAARPAAR